MTAPTFLQGSLPMKESFNLHLVLYNISPLEAAGAKNVKPVYLYGTRTTTLLSPAERRNLVLFLLKQPFLSLGSLIQCSQK